MYLSEWLKTVVVSDAIENAEKWYHSYIAGGNLKRIQSLWKTL